MRRRRNPGGILAWMTLHPWMTFFLLGAAISLPVELVNAAKKRKAAALPPPHDPADLSKPTPSPVPVPVPPRDGGGTVFVPGVIDVAFTAPRAIDTSESSQP